jgi:hypothetical protein
MAAGISVSGITAYAFTIASSHHGVQQKRNRRGQMLL